MCYPQGQGSHSLVFRPTTPAPVSIPPSSTARASILCSSRWDLLSWITWPGPGSELDNLNSLFCCSNAFFCEEGCQLWAFISQVFFGKNTKFLCSLDWKFPEFFKTHPTFICSSLFRASRSLWTLTSVFLGHPVYLRCRIVLWSKV